MAEQEQVFKIGDEIATTECWDWHPYVHAVLGHVFGFENGLLRIKLPSGMVFNREPKACTLVSRPQGGRLVEVERFGLLAGEVIYLKLYVSKMANGSGSYCTRDGTHLSAATLDSADLYRYVDAPAEPSVGEAKAVIVAALKARIEKVTDQALALDQERERLEAFMARTHCLDLRDSMETLQELED